MKINFSLFLILFLFACGTSKKEQASTDKKITPEILWNEMETSSASAIIDYTKPKIFHGAETIYTDIIHTKLEVKFDWNKSWLIGTATITAKPHFYSTDSLILDAKGMEIKTVSISNNPLKYAYDSSFLRIKLNKIYTKDESYTIKIDYIAKPNERETSGSNAISSDKGLYFINPKGEEEGVMPQIWTQGETEANSVWFPTIDAPNVKSTQEILITVENKYQTLSNGKLIKSTKNIDGTRTDHWKQDLPHAPYLFMMGVGEFKVVKDFYTRKNGEKMEVNYYVEPEWEEHAKAIFGETPKMIQFFSELTGVEYPWDKYHQIVVRDYVSGAMENTGAVIFGEFAYKTKRELIDEDDNSTIAHELFHHWFGDLVTCESWSNLPLNESFANYSQYLWDEYRYGLDEADFQAEMEKNGYYGSASNGGHHNLIWYDYEDKEQMFDGHSYNKGGRILHMLRNIIGDEAFFAGLKNYLKTNQFKAAEFHHLRLAFEEVTGQDLNWFFDQWFLASGHPILDIEQFYSEQNKQVVLTVYQNQDLAKTPLYRLPVEIMVVDDDGEHLHQIVINKVENKFVFPVSGTLKNVIFDYKQSTLGLFTESKPQEQFIHQYYNGKRYLARYDALINGTKKPSEASDKLILDALNDPFWDIKLLAIEKAESLKFDKQEKAIELITNLLKKDSKSDVRATAISYLANKLQKSDAENLLINSINTDSSYLVIGRALNHLIEINVDLAIEKAKQLEKEPSTKIKTSIAQIYANNGDEKHLDYFNSLMNDNKIKGYEIFSCLKAYTTFMLKQKPSIQLTSIPIYKKKHEKGSKYLKMFIPQYINYFIGSLEEKNIELSSKIETLQKNKDNKDIDVLKEKIKNNTLVIDEMNQLLKTF
jgi:aminopeptidase N